MYPIYERIFINRKPVELRQGSEGSQWFVSATQLCTAIGNPQPGIKAYMDSIGAESCTFEKRMYYTNAEGALCIVNHHNVNEEVERLARAMQTGEGIDKFKYASHLGSDQIERVLPTVGTQQETPIQNKTWEPKQQEQRSAKGQGQAVVIYPCQVVVMDYYGMVRTFEEVANN